MLLLCAILVMSHPGAEIAAFSLGHHRRHHPATLSTFVPTDFAISRASRSASISPASLTAAATTTSSLYALKPLSSLLQRRTKEKQREFEKRQRIREEIEDWEDEDFLLADIKPKALLHERDFFRQATRLQAWDEYVLVSILCTSISYTALQSFQVRPDHQGIFLYDTVLQTAIQIAAGFSSLSGLYSTMVFSLSILYCRTALGLERDPQYDSFLENTQQVRIAAFRAFSVSLACFAILVVLVLAESLPLVMHLPVGCALLGVLYVGYRDWKILVDNATDIFDYLDD